MNLKLTILIIIFIPLVLLIVAGSYLSAPNNHKVKPAPSDLGAVAVEFDNVKGWLVPGNAPDGKCIMLMHGIRSDRSSMIDRARVFKKMGYTSLLFDFQAHGESPGKEMTFGFLESKNAHSAFKYLKATGQCHKIAAIGQSLGGASALLGASPLPVDALILESVYPSIQDAVADRLQIRLGYWGRYLAPLLYQQIPVRFGVALAEFNPAESIKKIKCPVFIIAGSKDQHTKIAESKFLYSNAPHPKRFWEVTGAAHVDLYQFSREQYEANISSFLARYL